MPRLSVVGILLSVSFQISLALWKPNFHLGDLLKGSCRLVTPRVCKRIGGFDPDFVCGFILRHVCYGQNSPEAVLKEKDLHVTPLPRNMNFYDINNDGVISLKEFARTLGHSPQDLHVKVAFYSADRDGNRIIDATEFNNDVWWLEGKQRRGGSTKRRQSMRATLLKGKRNRDDSQSEEDSSERFREADDSRDVSEESTEYNVQKERREFESFERDDSLEHLDDSSENEIDDDSIENDESVEERGMRMKSKAQYDDSDEEDNDEEEKEEDDSREMAFPINGKYNDDNDDDKDDDDDDDSREMAFPFSGKSNNDKDDSRIEETDESAEIERFDDSIELPEESTENDEQGDDIEDDSVEDNDDDNNEVKGRADAESSDQDDKDREVDHDDDDDDDEMRDVDSSEDLRPVLQQKRKNKKSKPTKTFPEINFPEWKGGFKAPMEVVKRVIKSLTIGQEKGLLGTGGREEGSEKSEQTPSLSESQTTGPIGEVPEPQTPPLGIDPDAVVWVSVPTKGSRLFFK